jgi:hypothetical protein
MPPVTYATFCAMSCLLVVLRGSARGRRGTGCGATGLTLSARRSGPRPCRRRCTATRCPSWRRACCISCSSVTRMRQPDAPIGWPMAMAPPLTLTLLVSQPISWCTAQAWAAKASLISSRSRSAGFQPARSSALRLAGTGPMPMMAGRGRRWRSWRCAPAASGPARRPWPRSSPPRRRRRRSGPRRCRRSRCRPCRRRAQAGQASALVLRLMNSSAANTTGSPFFCGIAPARSRP